MASSGDGEPVQYLYTPDLDDEFYQQNLMLTHPTNILKLDEEEFTNPTRSTALGDSRFEGEIDDNYPSLTQLDNRNHNNNDNDYDDDVQDMIELSPDGILDEETISQGLDNLGRNADGTCQVFLDCTVSGYNLTDITLFRGYVHLQKIDVSYNSLTDINALSSIHHLIELDCSHNQLTECLTLSPAPANLRYANFSFNAISSIPDLSEYECLEYLNLDNNNISEMHGLSNCKRLRTLSLAHNHIKKMQGMSGLNIRNLCLKYNELSAIENLETLAFLQTIDLSGNKIRSLLGLDRHDLLECIDLENNEVIDITEVKFIKDLGMLRDLNLLRNPIQELPDYRLLVLFRIPKLKDLDRKKVDVKEKVSATNLFDPPIEVIAQRDHVMHVVYSFLQPKCIMESTLPSVETPYPMLVLVGPQGAGKKDLAQKLVEEFSDYFGYGVCHTTRKRQAEEIHGKDYKFVSIEEFEELIKLGCFIQTNMYNAQWYGLSMDSIESIAAEGLATVVNMELEGVLTLKKTHFSPRYVLILPMSHEAHEKRLRSRNMYTDGHIADILKRTQMYTDYNQDHPGFFDFMINSDDIGAAYVTLRRLILEYLGMNVSNTDESVKSGSGRQSAGSQGSRPGTGGRGYKLQNIDESNPKGSVLEASFIRRKEQAMDAVIGYIPSLYEQIVHKMPRTAPADLPSQLGLDGLRPVSQTVQQGTTRADSCNTTTSAASSSTGSTATESQSRSRSAVESVDDEVQENEKHLPTETINRIQLMSGSLTDTDLATSTDRPPSSRLGSARFQVLPPIADKPTGMAA